MTGFEPRTSGVGSDRSTNCTTTTSLVQLIQLTDKVPLPHLPTIMLHDVAYVHFKQLSCSIRFFKWASPASFSFTFVFSNKHYNFYNKCENLPNCQTKLFIALYTLSLCFCQFINTTTYHLGKQEPSSTYLPTYYLPTYYLPTTYLHTYLPMNVKWTAK